MQTEIKKSKNEEMSEAAKAARREYYRTWVDKNRERKNQLNRAYWERKAQKMKEEERAD